MSAAPDLSSFESFGKIARLRRDCLVTEKIDGTNAQVCIAPSAEGAGGVPVTVDGETCTLYAGSRKRWITPSDDNFGFARWAYSHAEELAGLGVGRHFGEWWGLGIQRGYGQDRKRFSLFNVARWADDRPECCDVVPVLYDGIFSTDAVDDALDRLRSDGSLAAPGFSHPEGVIVYHVAARTYTKVLLEGDELPKSVIEAERAAS